MSIVPHEFIRKRVRALRLQAGLTQEEFAEKIGMHYKYYQDIELGRCSNLRLTTLHKLAQGFGLELFELFNPHLIADPKPKKKSKQAKKK